MTLTNDQKNKIENIITNWNTTKNYGLITNLKLSLRTGIAPATLFDDNAIVALVDAKNNEIEKGFANV